MPVIKISLRTLKETTKTNTILLILYSLTEFNTL